MSIKEDFPAIKYGKKVGIDEVAASVVVAQTNGTSSVSVFGSAGLSFPIVITDIVITSLDTTAGNITVENPASTVVATVAKGTSSGTVVGSGSLSNTTVSAGTDLIVKSSSAGNARVKIFYIAG